MRTQTLRDTALSIAMLALLMIGVMALDPRVREQVSFQWQAVRTGGAVALADGQVRTVWKLAADMLRYQITDHPLQTLFVTVASVLLVFMLRL
jgi:hypothetical protein